MRSVRGLLAVVVLVVVSGCASQDAPTLHLVAETEMAPPPPGPQFPLIGSLPANPELSARTIIENAYAAAGGESWRRPKTLYMRGYGVFYEGNVARINERHEMWRVYPEFKPDAHNVDGKVRVDSYRHGTIVSQLGFDGARSFNQNGILPPSDADRQWAENFGFGVIRFALDPGYRVERLMDDMVDGKPCYLVKVIDPKGGETLFCIAHADSAILKVGFKTPRGWHERIYSAFFRKPGVDWVQPGRVRLYYNGVKQNEIIWNDFELNTDMPDSLFAPDVGR
jgi:hypothetical protein